MSTPPNDSTGSSGGDGDRPQPGGQPAWGQNEESGESQQGQYGQGQYGQGQYGQPQYGQGQQGQEQYGHPQQGPYGPPQPGQQYGQGQYGQGQYGQPQYGQPQYGQGQYGQPHYGHGPRRPGMATGAAVTALVVGVIWFIVAAFVLIGLGSASDFGASGFVYAMVWVATGLYFVGSIGLFVGAILLLSGKNNHVIRAGAGLAMLGALVYLITGLTESDGELVMGMIVFTVILLAIAGIILFMASGRDVKTWLERKQAADAAGYGGYGG